MILPYDTWGQVLFVFILSVVRYLVIGGLAFLFFYVLLKNKALFAKIQKKWPAKADYYREIFYSLLTFLIFSVTPLVLNNSYIKPYTTIYRDIHQHSMFYFWMVFPMMLVLHDTYFYFAHRIMHHQNFFHFFMWCIIKVPILRPGHLLLFSQPKPLLNRVSFTYLL